MNSEPSEQTPAHRSSSMRWFAWVILILIGGATLVMLLGVFQSVVKEGWHSKSLPFVIFATIFVASLLGIKAATHPTRGRHDERQAWIERFPARTPLEIERFLQVVGEELGLRNERRWRLHPDDELPALTQEWCFGDGMDIMELIMAVEREYQLELPESICQNVRSLGDLFSWVSEHSGQFSRHQGR